MRIVLGPVINQYNAPGTEIDRSLKRLETDEIVDCQSRFLSAHQ
jgi:hypothetical protein